MTKFKKEFLAVVLLHAFSMAYFWRGILADKITLIWDAADQFYPILAFNAYFLRNGILPLWNSFLFAGYPSFADPQAQTFYPINLILALFTNFTPKVIYCLLVFHYFLAGTFMFFLCRHLKYNRLTSLVGAISFMLSGFMVGHFQHLTQICTVAWLPIIFLYLDKTLDNRRLEYALIGAFFLCMSILAGHPQTYYYICLVLGIHWIYKTVVICKKNRKELFFNVKVGSILFGFGIMLAMIQLLPTIEFMQLSNRNESASLASSGIGINFSHLITFLIPNFYGGVTATGGGYLNWIHGIDISQQNLYMGILPILFSGWAILFGRGKKRIYYFVMSILAIFISMGMNTPVFSFFYHYVLGFSLFRGALNFIFVFHFFIAILAADGMNSFIKQGTDPRKFLLYLTLLLIGFTIYYLNLPKPPGEAIALKTSESGKWMFIVLFSLSVCIILLNLSKNLKKIKWSGYLIPAFLFLDIFFLTSDTITIGREFHDNDRVSPHHILENHVGMWSDIQLMAGLEQEKLIYNSDSLDLVQLYKEVKPFRVYTNGENGGFKLRLLKYTSYHIPLLHGMFMVDGYSPIVVKRHLDLTQFIRQKSTKRLMELYNARYQIFVDSHKRIIKELKPTLDRAMLVENALFMKNKGKILSTLSELSFNPYSTVIIEEEDVKRQSMVRNSFSHARKGDVQILSYLPNRIDLETTSLGSTYLLLNETYYPGWKAFVDDQEIEVRRANYNFKAIGIPKGKHKVSFVFDPVSYKIGTVFSLITLLIMMLTFFLVRLLGKKALSDDKI